MKKLLILLIFIPAMVYCQADYNQELNQVDILLKNNNLTESYLKLKNLESKISQSDTLYNAVLLKSLDVVFQLEFEARMKEEFEKSLQYGLEALELIKKGIPRFNSKFAQNEFVILKNIIISNYGLGRYEEGKRYKDLLYKGYKDNVLPKEVKECFNFDYFKIDDKNVWGYEWYPKLPENRFSSSFTKVVYYIYSTNPDGSDKEQLYRLHVLMFHGSNPNFDYVLDKKMETATNEISGTLYSYTYKEDIDFKKLHNDVIEIIKSNKQPDTQRIIPKK